MNDKKTPDDEHFDEGFNEDFDFGESPPEASSSPAPKPLPSQSEKAGTGIPKKRLMGVTLVVILVVGFIGYQFYGKKLGSKTTQKTSNISKAATPIAVPPKPSKPVEPSSPTLAEAPVSATQSATQTPKVSATTPQPKEEKSLSEIANAFSSADKAPLPTKEQSLQEQKALFTPEQATVQITNAPPPPPNMPSKESAQISQLMQSLNQLNQHMNDNINKIKHLDSYTQELSLTLSKLNETISTIDHRLLALTNTTTSLTKEMGNVQNDVGHFKEALGEDVLDLGPVPTGNVKSRCATNMAAVAEPEYTLHAVIPGRAWLKTTRGQILTVTEGEVLGNYGKVLVIDAANSVVLTSSGVTFR